MRRRVRYDGGGLTGSFPAKAALALSFGALVASIAPGVSAQTRSRVGECISDFERAQKERADGNLRDARAAATTPIRASF